MVKVDQFLEQLVHYNKEDIHPEIIKAIQPYLVDPEFYPDFIRTKSIAAAGELDTVCWILCAATLRWCTTTLQY